MARGRSNSAYPTLYQRIVRAAELGAGLALHNEEVATLAKRRDIAQQAAVDDEQEARARAAASEGGSSQLL